MVGTRVTARNIRGQEIREALQIQHEALEREAGDDCVVAGVTFTIPTLNEAHRLECCLRSIRQQAYPQELVEIVVADGGSLDRTVEIARSFGARVVHNERRLAEPGVALGMSVASHGYCVAFAADNVLPHHQWLQYMTRPLEEREEVGAAFTHIVNDPGDNLFNRYFNTLHADPFNAFIFGDGARPQRFDRLYPVVARDAGYTVLRFDPEEYPLLALAQGFMVRRDLLQLRSSEFDDILPLLNLIQAGTLMAYVPDAGVYHYSMAGFRDFVHKYNRRVINAMAHGYVQREPYLSGRRKIRQYLWLLYSLAVLPAALDAGRHLARRRWPYLFHVPANLLLTLLVLRHAGAPRLAAILGRRATPDTLHSPARPH